MAVLLANRSLSVRRATTTGIDGHGDRIGLDWGPEEGPWPGRAEEGPDVAMHTPGGRVWVLGVNPQAWPLVQGDMVVDATTGQRWLVTSADLLRNNLDSTVDYIRVEAHAYTTGTMP